MDWLWSCEWIGGGGVIGLVVEVWLAWWWKCEWLGGGGVIGLVMEV